MYLHERSQTLRHSQDISSTEQGIAVQPRKGKPTPPNQSPFPADSQTPSPAGSSAARPAPWPSGGPRTAPTPSSSPASPGGQPAEREGQPGHQHRNSGVPSLWELLLHPGGSQTPRQRRNIPMEHPSSATEFNPIVPSRLLQFHTCGIRMAPNPNLPRCSHTGPQLRPPFSQPKPSTRTCSPTLRFLGRGKLKPSQPDNHGII